jgi:hypothetical protein
MKFKNKYDIFWCDLCETAYIKCPACGNSSCNGGGCVKCDEVFSQFSKVSDNYPENFCIKPLQSESDLLKKIFKSS